MVKCKLQCIYAMQFKACFRDMQVMLEEISSGSTGAFRLTSSILLLCSYTLIPGKFSW